MRSRVMCRVLAFGLLAGSGCRSMGPDARLAARVAEVSRTSVELPA